MTAPLRHAIFASLGLAFLSACVPPAVVFLSQGYTRAHVQRVVLAGFEDSPNAPGSGPVAASIFEKYLLLAGYQLADRSQAETLLQQDATPLSGGLDLAALRKLKRDLGVDAVAIGQLTDYADASDHTVIETVPLEQTSPILGHQTVLQKLDGQRIRTETDVVTGYSTTSTDVPVQSVETVYAHVGLSVRLVDANTGELLWSGSASADAPHLHGALDDASSRLMQAVVKKLNP